MCKFLFASIILFVNTLSQQFNSIFAQQTKPDEKLTPFINPFIRTDGHGHTYPGATMPFGIMQLSPDTRLDGWDGCSGYHYSVD